MERTISVHRTGIFGTTLPLTPVHFDWSAHFSQLERNFPFHLTKLIVVSSTALLHLASAYRNNNQTRICLGRVCATGMFHCIRHVEFPKFLFNEKKCI